MVFDVLQGVHPLLHLPITPMSLDAVCCSLLNDLVDWKLRSASPPFISFETILDPCHCRNTFKKSFEEQDHLLVLVHVHSPVVIKDIEAHGNHDINVRWLKHQEVFVLILEHELVDERILLQTFERLC